ncbi:MAG: M3 family metallopeptidase [Thermoanaerobaculia bacterium]
MRQFTTFIATAICGAALISCSSTAPKSSATATPAAPAPVVAAKPVNPLVAPWTGPYGGVPAWNKVAVADFKPALEIAMNENLAAADAIAKNPAKPTFENTIAALEKSSRTFDAVQTYFGVWSNNMNSDEFQAVETEMAPVLAAFGDKITQNSALFARIEAVYNSPDKAKLTPEQQRLTWLYYTNFVRSGAKLDAKAKARMSEINQELAGLYTKFGQNVLADEQGVWLTIENEADLAGLPQSLRDAASAAADRKKLPGKWVISNTRSSVDPFLTYADRRDLREKAWRMFIMRGDNGDAHDNNALIPQILLLRAERAKLLGFETHAHWRLENSMAKNPERAMQLMEAVWKPAIGRVAEEVADMQKVADSEGAKLTIEPWDYRYYAEKVRKAKYDLDQNEVKQYLELEQMREAMFWVAGQLFNFKFTPITNVPVYHPDVRVWEVSDLSTGRHIGVWYFDPFARDGKRSGAWMNAYRNQERFAGDVTTIVSNNSNFVKGKPGEPVLISWDDATTLFHEFGHALHGLSSNVNYPSLSGTSVARDFVEFPSQLLPHWLSTPEVLGKFARHYKTGEPIPASLVERIKKADTFNSGFKTTEYLSSALIDMKMHLAGSTPIDSKTFEKKTLDALGMPKQLVMRHRPTQFLHIFSGDGYSAGYYSYLWSDTLTADAFEAFEEGKGPYDKEVARRLTDHVFSVGNTIDPADGYRAFRGRDPKIDALMRDRGFGK